MSSVHSQVVDGDIGCQRFALQMKYMKAVASLLPCGISVESIVQQYGKI